MPTEAETPVLELNAIGKRFHERPSLFQWLVRRPPGTRAVHDIDLSIRRSEVFGIIGESGSGKSTLGYVIANLEKPTSGTLLFHGSDVAAMPPEERRRFRRSVQVIFQDSASSLNPRRRVRSAVMDALRLAGIAADRRAARCAELATMVGLSSVHLECFPHELSGGQRQRIGIARALAMSPEVLIADEPVSALDVSLQGQIVNLLVSLREHLGLTIVLISHDLAVVRNVCDRVGVMFGGRLVEVGSTDAVIARPLHPYTQELIRSVPRGLDRQPEERDAPFAAVSGEGIAIPSPEGCPFAMRCGHAFAACTTAFPNGELGVGEHRVHCHLYGPQCVGEPADTAAAAR